MRVTLLIFVGVEMKSDLPTVFKNRLDVTFKPIFHLAGRFKSYEWDAVFKNLTLPLFIG